jgi:hypothetical protein
MALIQRTQELEERLRFYENYPPLSSGVIDDLKAIDEWNFETLTPISGVPGSDTASDLPHSLFSTSTSTPSLSILDFPSQVPADIMADASPSVDVNASMAFPYLLSDEMADLLNASMIAHGNAIPYCSSLNSMASLESALPIDHTQLWVAMFWYLYAAY